MNVVSLIVDGDGAASAIVPSVSGRSPADAEARPGRSPDERDGGERPADDGGADQRAGRAGGGGHGHEASSLRRVSTAPGSCPAPGNPALSGRRASNRASILRGMTSVTNRTFGAQSMTAPLREVLVKAPGPAFGRAFDDPAHGFLRPVDLDLARRQHDGLVSAPRRPRRRRSASSTPRPTTTRTSSTSSTRCSIADGGAIPLRPGKPNRAGEPAVLERVDARRGASRRSAASRRPAPSRAATRSGFAPTSCASGGRCGPTTPARASSPRSSAATSASSTSRTGRDRRSSSTCCRSSRPVADDVAVVFLPLLPVGLYAAPGRPRGAAGRGARGGVPDARLQRAGGPARGRHRRRGQRRHAARARGAPAARCTRFPLGEVGENGSGGADLPDAADPARMSAPATAAGSAPVERRGACRRRRRASVATSRISSGSQRHRRRGRHRRGPGRPAAESLGLAVERVRARPGGDPRRPGLAGRGDAARSRLPVVLGRVGPAGRAARGAVGPRGRGAARRSARPGRSTRGRRGPRRPRCSGAGPAT